MNSTISHLISLAMIILMALVFIVIQVVVDARDIRRSRNRNKLIRRSRSSQKLYRLDETISGALFVQNQLVKQLLVRLLDKKKDTGNYVFVALRHKNLIEYFKYSINKAELSLKSKILFILLTGLVILLFYYLAPEDKIVLLCAIFVFYISISIMIQARLKGYSLLDNINLLLIAPFSLIFVTIVYLFGLIKLLFDGIISTFKKLYLLN